ncbi:MAG: cadmium resistance transporter, partial [Methanobacterium sp.]
IISLILISSLGYFFKFIIPTSFISLLGIFPIIIGIKELIKLKRHQKFNGEVSNNKNFKRFSILEVALVSFSNGADNIGIYMPLFASINTYEMQAVITIFLLMIGVWCFIGHSLVNHKLLGDKIKKYGHIIFPFVLIALGIYILLK